MSYSSNQPSARAPLGGRNVGGVSKCIIRILVLFAHLHQLIKLLWEKNLIRFKKKKKAEENTTMIITHCY